MFNNNRLKTNLCKFYQEGVEGSCKMGEKCYFAHGEAELKEAPRNPFPQNGFQNQNRFTNQYSNPNQQYQNKYQGQGQSYGQDQSQGQSQGYGQGQSYGQGQNNNYKKTYSNHKTVVCKFFERGDCKNENTCNYAHGVEELKPAPQNVNRGEHEQNVNRGEFQQNSQNQGYGGNRRFELPRRQEDFN